MNAQEKFWAGAFGSEYTCRNRIEWEKRVPFWAQMLRLTEARSVLDVGCNSGWNLHAIRAVDKSIDTLGVDVNSNAVGEARSNELDVIQMPATNIASMFRSCFDLVCTSGVLIHVGPEELPETMQAIVDASRRWVLAVEYESEEEQEVSYRGNAERLWKRPFGRLYEAMGLRTVSASDAQGFDKCRAWLMEKP